MRKVWVILVGLLWTATAHAQTVPTTLFGTQIGADPTTQWPQYYFNGHTRLWGAKISGVHIGQWSGIYPTCSSYDFTGLDAALAKAVTQYTDLTYTFGNIPSCINSTQNLTTPTQIAAYFDLVKKVITDSVAQNKPFKYAEIWNEENYGSTWWVGTDATMVTMAQGAYPIIKSISPTTTVLSPSVTAAGDNSGSQIPISAWYHWQQFLSGCATTPSQPCFDVLNIHGYPGTVSASGVPSSVVGAAEVSINSIVSAKSIAASLGYGSYPLYMDEEWFGTPANDTSTSFDTDAMASQQVQGMLQMASNGVVMAEPDAYGTTCVCLTCCGNTAGTDGTGLNKPGKASRVMVGWLSGATFTSPMARQLPGGYNKIRTPPNDSSVATGLISGSGGCAGAPGGTGSLPTHWAISNAHSAAGMSVYVVGSGTDSNSVPYIRIRVCGTDSTSGSGTLSINIKPEVGNYIAAAQGQSWTTGADLALNAGSLNGVQEVDIVYNELDSGGGFLTSGTYYGAIPVSGSLSSQNYFFRTQLVNSSTAFIQPQITFKTYWNATTPIPIDFTIDIGNPEIDTGNNVWCGTITKASPANYQGEICYDASGPLTGFTVPNGYTSMRDMYGSTQPVTGGSSLTMTIPGPVIFDSSQWKSNFPSL